METTIEVQPLTPEEVTQAELQAAWEELQNVPSYVEVEAAKFAAEK